MDIASLTSAQTTPSTSAFSNLTKNIDTFLTLLTAQLRNQDPLEPLDTEKFTSQLVQFASVEQSIKTNSHLEALIALQGAEDRQSALGFVGREASVASDRARFDGQASWTYTLPQAAGAVALSVIDANGAILARAAGDPAAGAHAFRWDGALANGRAPDGVYRLRVDAVASDGAAMTAEIESTVRVNAASFRDGATLLETDIGAVVLGDIRRIAAAGE